MGEQTAYYLYKQMRRPDEFMYHKALLCPVHLTYKMQRLEHLAAMLYSKLEQANDAPAAPALGKPHPLQAEAQLPEVALAGSVQDCPAGLLGQAAPGRHWAAAGLGLPAVGCPAGLQRVASR